MGFINMHRGVVLATMLCAGIVLGVAVWMTMSPYFVQSRAVYLRNPTSGQLATCSASFANNFMPTNSVSYATTVCQMSCEQKGFVVVGGSPGDIDFVSEDAFRRAQRRWIKFIPPACRPTPS